MVSCLCYSTLTKSPNFLLELICAVSRYLHITRFCQWSMCNKSVPISSHWGEKKRLLNSENWTEKSSDAGSMYMPCKAVSWLQIIMAELRNMLDFLINTHLLCPLWISWFVFLTSFFSSYVIFLGIALKNIHFFYYNDWKKIRCFINPFGNCI